MSKRKQNLNQARVTKGMLGRGMWEKLHGRTNRPVIEAFAEWGWKWQPALCACRPSSHCLSQDEATKAGRT